jgi:hypothetical protein
MASIKGKLFEFFVFRLLVSCGFKPVDPDELLVYREGPGLMVQGVGQPHNADVLLSPPIQTPFYYPTRLLVECKCYNDTIGLPQIRNALGLRDDINNFEIVTKDILENRKHNRSSKPKFYDMKRYVYQVAVASIDGYKSTAYPFAKAHRIPLISFSQSALFAGIRCAISELDEIAKRNDELRRRISSSISEEMLYSGHRTYMNRCDCNEWQTYLEEVEKIERRITIGLLEDGTILFLLQSEQGYKRDYDYKLQDDGCTVHWYSDNDSTWELDDHGTVYYFELPKELYDDWKRSVGKQRKDALRIKRNYFSKIVLFHRTDGGNEEITILHLSEQFMDNAGRLLYEQDEE